MNHIESRGQEWSSFVHAIYKVIEIKLLVTHSESVIDD